MTRCPPVAHHRAIPHRERHPGATARVRVVESPKSTAPRLARAPFRQASEETARVALPMADISVANAASALLARQFHLDAWLGVTAAPPRPRRSHRKWGWEAADSRGVREAQHSGIKAGKQPRTKGASVSKQNDKQERIRQAEEQIRLSARRIDPYTARMVWWYAQTLDPYGLGYDLPPEADQVGREYFLTDPKAECAVRVDDVRELHPEIPDEEWKKLMRAAAERDDSPDPVPMFHAWRR